MNRSFILIFVVASHDGGDLGESAVTKACDWLSVYLVEVQRQLGHLLVIGAISIPESGAFAHVKWNHPRRARVRTDHQHVGITIADGELPVRAIEAQMCIANGRAILHFQLTHGHSFLTGQAGG